MHWTHKNGNVPVEEETLWNVTTERHWFHLDFLFRMIDALMHIVLKVCLTLVFNNHPEQLFQKFGFRCVWVLIIMLKVSNLMLWVLKNHGRGWNYPLAIYGTKWTCVTLHRTSVTWLYVCVYTFAVWIHPYTRALGGGIMYCICVDELYYTWKLKGITRFGWHRNPHCLSESGSVLLDRFWGGIIVLMDTRFESKPMFRGLVAL